MQLPKKIDKSEATGQVRKVPDPKKYRPFFTNLTFIVVSHTNHLRIAIHPRAHQNSLPITSAPIGRDGRMPSRRLEFRASFLVPSRA